MRFIRLFFALIIFVAGETTSSRTDAVTVTDEYGNPTQTDQASLSVGGVARPSDLLVSGGSRELASVLKHKRILETAGSQKTLAKDYDANVAEVENFKAKTSFYDLMLVASENQNAEGKRELEEMLKSRASIIAAVTNSAPIKPFAPRKPIVPMKPIAPLKPFAPRKPIAPMKPFAPKKPYAPQNPMAPMRPRKPTAPLMPAVPKNPAAPKKPAKPIGCPSGFNYNACCQGCGAVFTLYDALKTAVSNYKPSDTSFYGNMNCWDVAKVTDMSYLFYENWSFDERIDCWDVSQVTTMSWMFANTEYFNQPLNNWDTSRVKDMSYMFTGYYDYYSESWYYTPFNQPLNQWNTSSVTDMNQMLQLSSFNQPLAQWDISRVGNMYRMFWSAIAFTQNLCPWYNKTSAGVVYGDTFAFTRCPNTADPNFSTKTSFCANCNP